MLLKQSLGFRWLGIPAAFILSTLYLYGLTHIVPDLSALSRQQGVELSFPRSFEEIRPIVSLLTLYKQTHIWYALLLFSSGYIYKQTFAIPGSVMLNIIGGALFGVPYGFLLVCFLSAVGATSCYLLSRLFGKRYVEYYFPARVSLWQKKVSENLDSLFFFLLFSRLFPMSPNWLLNITSPLANIPIIYFFFSVFFGLMPYNLLSVQTGNLLSQISSLNEMFTWTTLFKMATIALMALVPGLLVRLNKSKTSPASTTAAAAAGGPSGIAGAAVNSNHRE